MPEERRKTESFFKPTMSMGNLLTILGGFGALAFMAMQWNGSIAANATSIDNLESSISRIEATILSVTQDNRHISSDVAAMHEKLNHTARQTDRLVRHFLENARDPS